MVVVGNKWHMDFNLEYSFQEHLRQAASMGICQWENSFTCRCVHTFHLTALWLSLLSLCKELASVHSV